MKTQMRSSNPTLASRLDDITQYAEVKRLTDTVMALQHQKGFRSLAVLSMFPGEGKTLFAAAMAMAYAGTSQSKVLVVDTTTVQDSQSLVLKQCLTSTYSAIEYMSLEDYRRGTQVKGNGNGNGHSNGKGTSEETQEWTPQPPALEADLVADGSMTLMVKKKSDQSLIQAMANDHGAQYGLVLLDTVPLTAKNRSNIDPMLVARMSDASVLIVSPRLLNSRDMADHLKVLRDPTLHLIGTISNEEFFQ